MNGLIVTADDFGAALAVNEAVEAAHRTGILTATSLMVAGEAAADAIARAHRLPSLKVGLHLVLVEGRPVLPPSAVPDLVDASGCFRINMALAGINFFFRPKVRRQLAAEIAAQFALFARSGLPLDHVNAHKHFHLHPTIARLIIEIGHDYGVTAARVPAEPAAVLRQIESGSRGAPPLLKPWLSLMRRNFHRAGFLTPNHVFGLAWSGAMTAPRLAGLLDHLPAGLSEIYLHPATANSFTGSAPGYRYTDEFAALTAPEVLAAAARNRLRRGGFADFAPAHRTDTRSATLTGAQP